MAAKVQKSQTLYFTVFFNRSEGLPERDISSLGVMGWGLDAAGNSSVAAQAGMDIRLGIRIDNMCVHFLRGVQRDQFISD